MLMNDQIGRSKVVLVAQEFGVLEGITNYWLDVAIGINATNVPLIA